MAQVKYGMSTFIGETLTGMPYPVFFDPHYPILINKPPITQVTGSPGSGKTFFGLIIASHASILNKTGIILDPKGDFIALKKLEQYGYINKINIWSVLSSNGEVSNENIGMLDPTTFTDNHAENTATTIDVITNLVGELTASQRATLTPIVKDIVEGPNPSFGRIVQKLLSNRNDEIRSLGYTLDTDLQTPLAKLLISNKNINKKSINLDEGFIVANLMGLSLPPDTKPAKDYDSKERVSVIIMGLLSSLVLKLMREKPKDIKKTLIIDEAWAVMATQYGRSMIQQVARLGRSLNLAGILLTQSPKHLTIGDSDDMDTMVSVRFAFRNNDDKDNKTSIKTMRLPENEGWEDAIVGLETGETLMQDTSYKASIVHIMAPDEWGELFNTNPNAKKQ